MRRDRRAYQWDVLEGARAIQSFLADCDLSRFAVAPMVQAAVERKFEIIGEALSQLSKMDSTLGERIPQLPQIVAFRNLLIHGYATVNHEIVWYTAKDSLPALITCMNALLQEHQGS